VFLKPALSEIGTDDGIDRDGPALAKLTHHGLLPAVGMDHVVATWVAAMDLEAAVGRGQQVGRLGADTLEAGLHGQPRIAPVVLLAAEPFLLNGMNDALVVADASAG